MSAEDGSEGLSKLTATGLPSPTGPPLDSVAVGTTLATMMVWLLLPRRRPRRPRSRWRVGPVIQGAEADAGAGGLQVGVPVAGDVPGVAERVRGPGWVGGRGRQGDGIALVGRAGPAIARFCGSTLNTVTARPPSGSAPARSRPRWHGRSRRWSRPPGLGWRRPGLRR